MQLAETTKTSKATTAPMVSAISRISFRCELALGVDVTGPPCAFTGADDCVALMDMEDFDNVTALVSVNVVAWVSVERGAVVKVDDTDCNELEGGVAALLDVARTVDDSAVLCVVAVGDGVVLCVIETLDGAKATMTICNQLSVGNRSFVLHIAHLALPWIRPPQHRTARTTMSSREEVN